LLIDPTEGFRDQVTFVFAVPLTEAVKVWLCPPVSDTFPGERVMLTNWGGDEELLTGFNVMGTDALRA